MEETRIRVCHVLILCTTIVQNVLVSKHNNLVLLSVDVRDAKTPMDKDQMLTNYMVFRKESRTGTIHRFIHSGARKQPNLLMRYLKK